jgi:hypothetical protein
MSTGAACKKIRLVCSAVCSRVKNQNPASTEHTLSGESLFALLEILAHELTSFKPT